MLKGWFSVASDYHILLNQNLVADGTATIFFWKAKIYILLINRTVPEVLKRSDTRHLRCHLPKNKNPTIPHHKLDVKLHKRNTCSLSSTASLQNTHS